MPESGHDSASGDQERDREWLKYLNHQSDWLEKTRGNLMVVATVIATMSFQVMVNPPGGVWQDDDCGSKQIGQMSPASSPAPAQFCKSVAGTSVLEHGEKGVLYLGLVISSSVSFSASLGIILLVISGVRIRNRFVMWILISFMVVAVFCIAIAFALSIALVQSQDAAVELVLYFYAVFWVVFPVVILLIHLVRFLVWVLCFVFCCYKPRNRPVRPVCRSLPNRARPSP